MKPDTTSLVCPTVGSLSVDHLAEPANIGPRPSFAWQMRSERPGAAQTAYRIEVRDAKSDLLWDSGVVESPLSVGIRYDGPALKSATHYVWEVSVRDEAGAWLAPAQGTFDTGLFAPGDWDGSIWISAADSKVSDYPSGTYNTSVKQEAEDGTACFQKSVPNGKDVAEAWWCVAGLGVFEAYVNGEKVGNDFLKPGFTHCDKTKYSFAYDVTSLLRTGAADENTFSAEVSAGWWRDKIVNFHGKRSAFRAQLILRHADGTETRVGTDTTWLASGAAGPVLHAAIFDGEDYDARRAGGAGAEPAWSPAIENTEFTGELLPMVGPTIRLREDRALAPAEAYVWQGVEGADDEHYGTVVKCREYLRGSFVTAAPSSAPIVALAPGETLVVDFGQNAAAVPEFVFSAPAGTTLTARPAEMLNDGNGAKSRGCDGPEGSAYFTNYRQARTTIHYTFAGSGAESYRPRFTFLGYRYLSITADGPVEIRSLRSVPVTSIHAELETGHLETGVADVNRLISNVLWGQYSNYLSVPTDCPQRNERLGWTADTQVFTRAASYNADVYGFFLKWMRDMRDTQHADGSYTGVAPLAQYGDLGHQLGWADAGVIVPWTMWRQFGDTRIVEENWDSMERYLALLEDMKFDSPEAREHQWGDWLSYEKLESCGGGAYETLPDGTRRPSADALTYWQFLGCCYWLWDSRMMAEMAGAIGRGDAAAAYGAMAGRALAFLRERFVSKDDGLLIPLFRDMQTPALFALKLGLLEEKPALATRHALLANIREHGDCLQTGFLGTSILMDTLTYDAASPEVAYTLLLQHKNPSWLYSVDQGATTIWERWNSYTKAKGFGAAGMNSFNHYAYGAVLAWMYGTMAGIREDPAAPGYRHFLLAPRPDLRIGRVDATFRSPYGPIDSAWRYEGGDWVWRFTIPANASATVTVPGEAPREYAAGTYEIRRPRPDRADHLYMSHVHRGGGKFERPDNTLSTFLWCWGNGSALECDCRRTRDGVGIMLHDATLRRTGTHVPAGLADKPVSEELDWADIRDIDVGSYLSPGFSHHRIPTIGQVFAAMAGHPTWLCFVDEKGAGPAYIAEKAREAGVLDQVYYSGPSPEKALEWVKAVPGGKTMLWIGTWPVPAKGHPVEDIARFEAHFEKVMDELRANDFRGISIVSLHSYYDRDAAEPFVPRASYLRKLVDEFHAHGIPVCSIPFSSGDAEEVYFRLFDLGFDGFSSDYPSTMFSVIHQLKQSANGNAAG